MTEELKPCPFCGEKTSPSLAKLEGEDNKTTWTVYCRNGYCMTSHYGIIAHVYKKEDAIEQ